MLSDLDLACAAARAGSDVALRHFAALAELPREVKPDGSLVTAADRETEIAIRELLSRERPGDALLGEEGGAAGEGRRRWIVDPIDGTAQFLAGDNRWLVLVALEEDGAVVAAAAAEPAQGTLWWASRGGGAFRSALDGTGKAPVTVPTDRPDVLEGARLGVVPAPPNYLESDRLIAAPLAARATTVDWDVHAPLMVASGGLDLAVQTRGQVWDFAATSLIVTEAGGAYGGVDGIRGPRPGTSLFARSPALWEEARRALWG
ncbi:inositol monophosphatase family protein [Actinoplanes sp. NPDC049681]|uniref:inositol monophosphatase family protein n=1 Tax=Actinoplanes sp. NPDC049681 TaxID=3363905 RepID=UPI003798190C